MKVSEIMQKHVTTVTEEDLLKEVGRIIFSLGLSGIPVLRGTKMVGIVTQKDILSNLYPTISDLAEDYVHARSFEKMEDNLTDILNLPISLIMTKDPVTIDPDLPIMNAQSIMLVRGFSHLPVVDKDQNLLGIVSQGDIFRTLIKDEIPALEQQKYADFIANHLDKMVDWQKREEHEYPALIKLLDESKAKKIVEFGVWTGQFTTDLAKLGKYKILGLDHNPTMIDLCNRKVNKLPEKYRSSISFKLTDYKDVCDKIKQKFDAAICVGNGLAYVPVEIEQVFKEISCILEKKSILFLQVLNFDKILKRKGKLLNFKIEGNHEQSEKEELIVDFFEINYQKKLIQNLIHFDSDGKNWLYKGITSINIHYLNKEILKKALVKIGFKDVSFYGGSGKYKGESYELNFKDPFDEKESDWLNVVAKR